MINNVFSKVRNIFIRVFNTGVFEYCVEYCSRPTTLVIILFLVVGALMGSIAEVVIISILLLVIIFTSAYYYAYTVQVIRASSLITEQQGYVSRSFIIDTFLPASISETIYKSRRFARWLCGGITVVAFIGGFILGISPSETISLCLLVSLTLFALDVPLFLTYLYSKISRTMQVDLATMLLHKVLIYLYLAAGVCIVSTLAVLGIALPLVFTPAFIIWIAVFVYIFVPVLISFGFVDTTPEAFSHRIDTKSFLGLQISSRPFLFTIIGISLLVITFFMMQLHNGYSEALAGVYLLSVFLMWCVYICILRADSSLHLLRSSRDERLRIGLLLLAVVAESLVLYISFFKSAFQIQAPSIEYWIAALLLSILVGLAFYTYRWFADHLSAYNHSHDSLDTSKK